MTSNLKMIEPRPRTVRSGHQLSEVRIRFVGHPDFDDPTALAEILGPMPGPVGRGKSPGKARSGEVLPVSDADLQDSKFLTREQEVHLFRKMNFLKHQAAQLHQAINPSRADSGDLDRVEELLRDAGAIRNRIIRSYVRLVIFTVKKCAGAGHDFSDLVSEGYFALIRASEQFDFARHPVQHIRHLGHHQRSHPANSEGAEPPGPVRHRPRGAVARPR